MNNGKLGIVTCANYFRELQAIVSLNENSNIELFCLKPTCFNPTSQEKKAFIKQYNSFKQRVQELVVLTPNGCTGLNSSCANAILSHSSPSVCTELLASKSIVNQLIDEGNYIVTPGWLGNWETFIKRRCKFDKLSATQFFNDTTKQICVLDTGVYDDYSTSLKEFSEFVGLKYQILHIGLDFFQNHVDKILLSWQQSVQAEITKRSLRSANKKIADYTMALEIINDISILSSEEAVVKNIFHLFITLFTPQKMTYFPIVNGEKGIGIYYPADQQNEFSIIETPSDTSLQKPENGFKINATYNNELLGYIEIEEILFSEFIDNYSALTQSISSVLGLLIYNSRQFNRVQNEKIEIQHISETILQQKNRELQKINIDLLSSENELKATNEELTVTAENLVQSNYELELAVRKAEANEEKYKLLSNLTFEGIALHQKGIALDVNLTFQKMLGYSYDELIGKDLIKTIVLEKYHDLIYQNILRNYQFPYEIEGRRRDGAIIPIELEGKNIESDQGDSSIRVIAVRDITKRKEAESAIERERTFNLNLIETLPGIFFLYEMQENNAILLKWNKNHEIFLGYSNTELYQMHLMDFFSAEQFDQLDIALNLIKQEEEIEVELNICHKNGTQIPYFLRGKGFSSNGRSYFVGIGLDITEQKNNERELILAKEEAEKSEEKYRNWFEHFPHATYIWKRVDDDFEMVRANKRAYEESNGDVEKIFGTKSRILWQDEPDLTNYLVECFNTKQSRTIERKYYFRGSGEEKYTSTTYSFIPPDSIQIISVDITQQKIADDALKSQKLLFETMFNTISDAVIMTDTDRKIIVINEGMSTIFGYELEEIIGQTAEYLYENINAFSEAGDRVFNLVSENVKARYIANYRSKSNKIFPGETFGSKLFDARGKWIGNLAIIRDVSEREALISDLIKARDLAEESNRLKSAFLLNMSHEIKTPMNAINGFSQLINKPNITPEKREQFSSIIVSSSMQLQSIVEDILTISALETKQHTISYQPLSINKTVAELYEIFKGQAQSKEISLVANTSLSDTDAEIYTDKTKFTQVFTNLIVNALKFTHEGSVQFGYELSNNELMFYVKDTGIGISPEMQEKIFERFVQVETGMIRQYGGNGLGLSISKGFVELLGGSIWVESILKKGSTFYFTIPYVAVNKKNSDEDLSQRDHIATILIAEDEKYNFLFIEALLSRTNLNLIHALDGNEAVELCRLNNDISLVLMDVKMPNMDGYTAAVEIKEIRPNLPIIAQTAYSFEQYSAKYGDNPFDDYITKPIRAAELKEKINTFIKFSK